MGEKEPLVRLEAMELIQNDRILVWFGSFQRPRVSYVYTHLPVFFGQENRGLVAPVRWAPSPENGDILANRRSETFYSSIGCHEAVAGRDGRSVGVSTDPRAEAL